eukprot:jgi/Undpi1/12899/HiC_scaffold_7.g02565.m1
MKFQRSRSVSVVALSCSMLLLGGMFTASSGYKTHPDCVALFLGDGDCDDANNNVDCGYDLGDCCEKSCADSSYVCGQNGFNCLDPDYLDGEYPQMLSYSFEFQHCDDDLVGNGYCNTEYNTKECGYDGGDCCSCSCTDCGGQEGYTCIDPRQPCLDGYVEAGTLTTVTASANGFLATAGAAYGGEGCMRTGCKPKLTRDDNVDDEESRWSCRSDLVADGSPCYITYYFAEAQEVEYLQVAFWDAEDLGRTLQIYINGVHVGEINRNTESTYTAFSLHGYSVETLSLTATASDDYKWVSLLEVRFLVEDSTMYAGGP